MMTLGCQELRGAAPDGVQGGALKFVTVTNLPDRIRRAGIYFFTPVGGTGTRIPVPQLPVPVLDPVIRPEPSRRVLVMVPLPWVVSLPVICPEALRKVVREVLPVGQVEALPAMRPVASR
jgi:hypothetical protein